MHGIALAAGLAGSTATAGANPPVPAPRPPASREAPQSEAAKLPVPRKRPDRPSAAAPSDTAPSEGKNRDIGGKKGEAQGKDGSEADKPEPVPVPGVAEDGAALAACYKALDALGTAYAKKGTVNDAGECGMEAPVSVTAILPGVTMKPAAEMRCATALALARWVKRVVEPAAAELGDAVRLTGLSQGSSYVCRHRDGDPDRKISQHAFGNAVDIVTFRFDGHPPLSIAPRERTGRIEEGFQRAVIGGACLYFTTVLGPRADSYHQDNLHLDIDARSNGFRLCQ